MSAPQRPELADELRRRAEADQQARSFLGPDNEPTDAQIRHCQAVDADNTAWLAAIVTEHGWPGIRLVGEQGARRAWLDRHRWGCPVSTTGRSTACQRVPDRVRAP